MKEKREIIAKVIKDDKIYAVILKKDNNYVYYNENDLEIEIVDSVYNDIFSIKKYIEIPYEDFKNSSIVYMYKKYKPISGVFCWRYSLCRLTFILNNVSLEYTKRNDSVIIIYQDTYKLYNCKKAFHIQIDSDSNTEWVSMYGSIYGLDNTNIPKDLHNLISKQCLLKGDNTIELSKILGSDFEVYYKNVYRFHRDLLSVNIKYKKYLVLLHFCCDTFKESVRMTCVDKNKYSLSLNKINHLYFNLCGGSFNEELCESVK